jgi:predicted Rossmann-fold nucleotide-binding protein
MSGAARKFVLIIGTGWATAATRRAARMIGTTLAESGFGLVCGNSTGVDRWVADAFCAECAMLGVAPESAFVQVSLGGLRFFHRGGAPLPGYRAPDACVVRVDNVEGWRREALARSHAAVMVGGGSGSLEIARRFIERGMPVFPVPFLGGTTANADMTFQEILRTWDSHPVPGLSRTQFLGLAEPWVSGTGPIANLLRGTLADAPDIFVSYRRSDAPAAAGRIARDLEERFGQQRVFLDIRDIAPSRAWDQSIDGSLASARVGVVVIGRTWLAARPDEGVARLHRPDDVVRSEIRRLIEGRKAIFPILVEGADLPEAADLPEDLRPMLRFQATSLDNAGWDAGMARLMREIEALLRPTSGAAARIGP